MKNYAVKGALCAVLCGGSLYAITQQEFEALLQAELQANKSQQVDTQVRLKKLYGSLMHKTAEVFNDNEVVAARKNLYGAIKRLSVLVQAKVQISEQEKAELREIAAFLQQAHESCDEASIKQFFNDSAQVVTMILLEMGSSQGGIDVMLKKAAEAEVEMFKNS